MAEAAYTFTLPSVADDTTLECRVYHPPDIDTVLSRNDRGIGGAVFAHPYAPLGGSYDDPVVLSVTETLLEQGYIIGTFNFRGASGSQGSTTWTGRAETEDYVSVTGFMIYYLHHLNMSRRNDTLATIPSAGGRVLDQDSEVPFQALSEEPIRLLLGGYSYGSLVLARLPSPQTITAHFQEAAIGTAAAEIILRARMLAKQTLQAAQELQSPARSRGRALNHDDAAASPTQRAKASPVMVGGEETDPSERRQSRDSRRSADIVRKSVEMPHRIKARIRRHSDKTKPNPTPEKENPHTIGGDGLAPRVRSCYLLVSPVLLPFTNILCPPGPPTPTLGSNRRVGETSAGSMFLQRPTLALFGTSDIFTSSRRLRAWAEKQAHGSNDASFTWEQIDKAGHFWREEGVMQALQARISSWVNNLSP
ncbi:hypothetical protein LTR85_009672 [Meristemomyces frigidus]|nr:hypothetical protein LTR85_009672 [Meristemomyces frigidus]